jgi:hypothetical protein
VTLRIALIVDGSSDTALRFPCEWLLKHQGREDSVEVLPEPTRHNLARRIQAALEAEPDILIVHRDAEKESWESRRREIQLAVDSAGGGSVIGVVPVRMTEAWLLIDETAIRRAAGNPNGTVALNLPRIDGLQGLPDPKEVLFEKLRRASELSGRRLKKLNVQAGVQRVAALIADYSPLQQISALQRFQEELSDALEAASR